MDINQGLLDALGVGHSSLTNICDIAKRFKCGAKLTGAGGGGCAIVLLPVDETAIIEGEAKIIEALK